MVTFAPHLHHNAPRLYDLAIRSNGYLTSKRFLLTTAPICAMIARVASEKPLLPLLPLHPLLSTSQSLAASFSLFCSSCPWFSAASGLFSQITRVGGSQACLTSDSPTRPLFSASTQRPLRLGVILRRRFYSLLSTILVPSSNYL